MSKEEAAPVGRNLTQRMMAVMKEIGIIEKNGRNNFQNYDYATEADFVLALTPLLLSNGVQMQLLDQKVVDIRPMGGTDGKKQLTTISATYIFRNEDAPTTDYYTVTALGQGVDAGDKGVYKAITGAKKYAIANAFMIATGDDPEKESAPKTRASKPAALKSANSKVKSF